MTEVPKGEKVKTRTGQKGKKMTARAKIASQGVITYHFGFAFTFSFWCEALSFVVTPLVDRRWETGPPTQIYVSTDLSFKEVQLLETISKTVQIHVRTYLELSFDAIK